MPTAPFVIRRLTQVTPAQVQALAEVLIDCVEGQSSVGFLHPLSPEKAQAFWARVAHDVSSEARALLVAEEAAEEGDTGAIVGTVHLVLDQPENQPHRADLCKMLVHRQARRRGVGAALMQAAETLARDCGKSLLVLDTADATAARLYERQGWQRCGEIPGFALLPHIATFCSTTIFYRTLSA